MTTVQHAQSALPEIAPTNPVTARAKKTVAAPKLPVKPATKPAAKRATKASVNSASVSPAKPLPEASKVIKTSTVAAVKPKQDKPAKSKKPKLVRDSFTIPKAEYLVLDELKLRAAKLASPVKKTELIRAGIKALAGMSDTSFLAAVKAVPVIKTGRPALK